MYIVHDVIPSNISSCEYSGMHDALSPFVLVDYEFQSLHERHCKHFLQSGNDLTILPKSPKMSIFRYFCQNCVITQQNCYIIAGSHKMFAVSYWLISLP